MKLNFKDHYYYNKARGWSYSQFQIYNSVWRKTLKNRQSLVVCINKVSWTDQQYCRAVLFIDTCFSLYWKRRRPYCVYGEKIIADYNISNICLYNSQFLCKLSVQTKECSVYVASNCDEKYGIYLFWSSCLKSQFTVLEDLWIIVIFIFISSD